MYYYELIMSYLLLLLSDNGEEQAIVDYTYLQN